MAKKPVTLRKPVTVSPTLSPTPERDYQGTAGKSRKSPFQKIANISILILRLFITQETKR
jgi:hypothetical protein